MSGTSVRLDPLFSSVRLVVLGTLNFGEEERCRNTGTGRDPKLKYKTFYS